MKKGLLFCGLICLILTALVVFPDRSPAQVPTAATNNIAVTNLAATNLAVSKPLAESTFKSDCS